MNARLPLSEADADIAADLTAPPAAAIPGGQDRALLDLLRMLRERGYGFVTPTPATQARVLARPGKRAARDIVDMLGWSLPFEAGTIDGEIEALLGRAGVLERGQAGLLRSAVRVSALHGNLYLHSAYPTEAKDAVFFGPDSYRFADLIARELDDCPRGPDMRIADIGAGAGVGGIVAATQCRGAAVTLTDINAKALRLARLNALAAGVRVETVHGEGLSGVDGEIDVALANPPYIIDRQNRAYRDGGGMHGAEVALGMAREAITRLAPGGRLILYTGSAIVRGEDALRQALEALCGKRGCSLRYRVIDPDVFGEELERAEYAEVERIALVAAVVGRG